jgi:ABC-type transport system substrate-binding protein
MLNYDVERAPFDHREVRQAMSLAIDRQDLVDTVYLGTIKSAMLCIVLLIINSKSQPV